MDEDKKISDALKMRSLAEAREDIEDVEYVEMPDDDGTGKEITPYSESLPPVMPEPDGEVLDDIDTAKKNILDIITQGNEGLKEIFTIAAQSQSPAAFDSAQKMMKTLLDANRDLVNMSKEKKYEKSEQPAQHVTNNVTNNLTLSTSDLLQMIRAKSSGDKPEDLS